MQLGLLAGVEIDLVQAIVAPDMQQHVRPRRAAPLYLPRAIFGLMQYDLSPEDRAAIAELLRDTIKADQFPLSPRIKRMREILHKIDPPEPEPFRFPPLKQGRPSQVLRKQAPR